MTVNIKFISWASKANTNITADNIVINIIAAFCPKNRIAYRWLRTRTGESFYHSNNGYCRYNTDRYIDKYFSQASQIIQEIDKGAVEAIIKILLKTKENGGRLFILGVGGSAGNATHAVNDFRKISGIEAYSPTDNVSELTARINDDGWDSAYANWLKGSKINSKDCVFVFSVGGGNSEKNISINLIESLKLAKTVGASIIGIVGRDGGYTAKVANACVIVPTVDSQTVTPHTESFQGVVWHLIVSHPAMKAFDMKWESTK